MESVYTFPLILPMLSNKNLIFWCRYERVRSRQYPFTEYLTQ